MFELVDAVSGGINGLPDPKTGENTLHWYSEKDWKNDFDAMKGPLSPKQPLLPTHPGMYEDIKAEVIAKTRSGKIKFQPFKQGPKVIYDLEQEKFCPKATVAYWMNTNPYDPPLKGSQEDIDSIYRLANPFIRKVANALCQTIEDDESSKWKAASRSSLVARETHADKAWHSLDVLLWVVKEVEFQEQTDGTQAANVRVTPMSLLCGVAEYALETDDPFNKTHTTIASALEFMFQLDAPRFDALMDGIPQDGEYKYQVLMQFMDSDAGGWIPMSSRENLPTYMLNDPPASVRSNFIRAPLFDFAENIDERTMNMWRITDEDFIGAGFHPSLRSKVSKARRYGKQYRLMSGHPNINDPTIFPTVQMLMSDIIVGASEYNMIQDDGWEHSSRYVESWRDKRKIKIINKASGSVPYWSDVVRCPVCNGQCQVILIENPNPVIFDCPHCGEGGCIDCSHLRPGEEWPDQKKRKKVDLK